MPSSCAAAVTSRCVSACFRRETGSRQPTPRTARRASRAWPAGTAPPAPARTRWPPVRAARGERPAGGERRRWGGGSGGGPGGRGPGGGGGGSFAVAVFASTNIDVRDCSLRTGLGGAGGVGGIGGTGGPGGPGGVEARECRSTVGAGGTGGAGRAGGRGGHGGGGGGGPTVGIAWDETSTLAQSGNSYTLGTAGIGGSSSGQNGSAGVRQNTLQMPAAASASRQGFSASRQGLSGRRRESRAQSEPRRNAVREVTLDRVGDHLAPVSGIGVGAQELRTPAGA